MIFLSKNTHLKEDLTFDHIKPRLLGMSALNTDMIAF